MHMECSPPWSTAWEPGKTTPGKGGKKELHRTFNYFPDINGSKPHLVTKSPRSSTSLYCPQEAISRFHIHKISLKVSKMTFPWSSLIGLRARSLTWSWWIISLLKGISIISFKHDQKKTPVSVRFLVWRKGNFSVDL